MSEVFSSLKLSNFTGWKNILKFIRCRYNSITLHNTLFLILGPHFNHLTMRHPVLHYFYLSNKCCFLTRFYIFLFSVSQETRGPSSRGLRSPTTGNGRGKRERTKEACSRPHSQWKTKMGWSWSLPALWQICNYLSLYSTLMVGWL